MKFKIKKYPQLGSDRIANAIGAYYKFKTNCIVIDFGTATTLDVIKNERFCELYGENHHIWDLKTWRDAEAEIHMKPKWGVKWFRRASDGLYKARRWRWNFSQNTPFLPKMYWLPIGTAKIADNPSLVENPGY